MAQDVAETIEDFLGWIAGGPHDTVLCRMVGDSYEPTQYVDEGEHTLPRLIRDWQQQRGVKVPCDMFASADEEKAFYAWLEKE